MKGVWGGGGATFVASHENEGVDLPLNLCHKPVTFQETYFHLFAKNLEFVPFMERWFEEGPHTWSKHHFEKQDR